LHQLIVAAPVLEDFDAQIGYPPGKHVDQARGPSVPICNQRLFR
jgi:hypothetical protein